MKAGLFPDTLAPGHAPDHAFVMGCVHEGIITGRSAAIRGTSLIFCFRLQSVKQVPAINDKFHLQKLGSQITGTGKSAKSWGKAGIGERKSQGQTRRDPIRLLDCTYNTLPLCCDHHGEKPL